MVLFMEIDAPGHIAHETIVYLNCLITLPFGPGNAHECPVVHTTPLRYTR